MEHAKMNVDVMDMNGKKVGTTDLPADIFEAPVRRDLMHQAFVRQMANARLGTHKTKTRSEVRGGGRKPWRQKGTGRARVGEIRNPLWRKGGTVFGPQPRSYDYRLPKKVERGALRAAIAQKLRDGQIVVVDALASSEGRTKAAVELLTRLGVAGKTLIIDVAPDDRLVRAVRNVAGVSARPSGRVTAREVMYAERVVTTQSALEHLQDALA
jgi:large subunit ribosomal protein L4